jgi:hypothetical protein
MLAGEREALLQVVDELCAELGYPEDEGELPDARSALQVQGGLGAALSKEDESLVTKMRRGLARVEAAIRAQKPERAPAWGAGAALDGVELVMRGELMSGNAQQLPSLVPAFVFLVSLSITEHDEALDLSRRASELIEGALR